MNFDNFRGGFGQSFDRARRFIFTHTRAGSVPVLRVTIPLLGHGCGTDDQLNTAASGLAPPPSQAASRGPSQKLGPSPLELLGGAVFLAGAFGAVTGAPE